MSFASCPFLSGSFAGKLGKLLFLSGSFAGKFGELLFLSWSFAGRSYVDIQGNFHFRIGVRGKI